MESLAKRPKRSVPHPISSGSSWKDLEDHVSRLDGLHLRELLQDVERVRSMVVEGSLEGVRLDYSRQVITKETVLLLMKLAEQSDLKGKMRSMFSGETINETEGRAVLHHVLRSPEGSVPLILEGKNVLDEVHSVLKQIKCFSEEVRSGRWKGKTGKPLVNVVAVGIGGSFLGPLFVHNALQTHQRCAERSAGLQLRFLANVDPVDYARAIQGLDPATTLVVIISKTFTTAETMLNARTMRQWITSELGEDAVAKHMVAVSTNHKLVEEFGIDPKNTFAFWDWVGGRFSVCSAVGILPLALQYGFEVCREFLDGAHAADEHFIETEFCKNIPVLMGLLSIWNSSFLGHATNAILPYSQALEKFAPHIQQLSMESNGKSVEMNGTRLPFQTGEIYFGEPGTNGQHSFYQLIHQGRLVPCEFIGIANSQQPIFLEGERISNHDELMCNFFAQADALACGKTPEELRESGVPEALIPHKTFSGNRPSLSLLLKDLSPFRIGQLLSIYEARVAVEGFIWGINSFDQWGVELGKVLATKVRETLTQIRLDGESAIPKEYNPSTAAALEAYIKMSS